MINPALLHDITVLRQAIKDNLAIIRPTTFNSMQLDELRYILACYEKELEKVSKGLEITGREALEKDVPGRANYERHEAFSDKNRGL